jgi:hypothetical protein
MTSDETLRRAMQAELESAFIREQDFRTTLQAVALALEVMQKAPEDARNVKSLTAMALTFIEHNTGITP